MHEKVYVLHYVPGFDHGGIESRLLDWYRNIDRSKVQFDLLKVTTDNDNPMIEEFKSLGGKVYTLPKFTPKTYFRFKANVKKFFDDHNKYKVIHCHSPITGKYVINEAKRHNVTTRIMHSRTIQFNKDSSFKFFREYLKKASFKNATDYFACSKKAGEWLFGPESVKKNKVKVINNGIESERFIYNSAIRTELRKHLDLGNSFVIGNVGRFSQPKNHSFMIDIFSEFNKKHHNSKLLLIGEGPEKERVIQKVNKLDLSEKVLFLGKQENIWEYLQCIDLFLFPSFFEGFGTTAIEAQAAGLITIASDAVPPSVDITDLIQHLPLSTNAKAWADTMQDYSKGYERKNMYEEIVKAGFDVKYTTEFLEKVYLGGN